MPSDAELTRLLLAGRRGDVHAWNQLEQVLFPWLCEQFRRNAPNQDHEDLAQETIVRIWRDRNFDPSRNPGCNHPFQAWAKTIARNCLTDKGEKAVRDDKKHDAWRGQQSREANPTPEEHVVANEDREALSKLVEQCLADLTDDHRKALVLEMHGLSYRDIAQRLGIPDPTAATRRHRAHKAFEAAMLKRRCVLLRPGEPIPPGAEVLGTFRKGTVVRPPEEETP